MSQNSQEFDEFFAICQETGAEFTYSRDAWYREIVQGRNTPSQAEASRRRKGTGPKAITIASDEIPSDGIPGFTSSEQNLTLGPNPSVSAPHLMGSYGGEVDPNISVRFRFIDPFIDRLLEELCSPTGRRVAIFSTFPGSGKSTWLIYRLRMSSLGMHGRILVTQPRTVTLRQPEGKGYEHTVPGFIADYLLNQHGIGAGREIGVLFRGESTQHDRHTKVLFLTDGILTAWLSDGIASELARYSVIVIDEAHELSTNMEFILIMLRLALDRYPHLRVVIASATMDEERFVRHFGGPDKVLVVKQPPETAPQSKTIYDHFPEGEDGYAKLIDGFTQLSKPEDAAQLPEMVKSVVLAIREKENFTKLEEPRSNILVFLPTIRVINETRELLAGIAPDLTPIVCHAQMNPQEEEGLLLAREISEQAEHGSNAQCTQYVFLATTYAETSVTFPIRYVIDSGLITDPIWDPEFSGWRVSTRWHTQAGCLQRRGRVGRHREGEVFRLYTQETFNHSMPRHPIPALQREPMDRFLASALRARVNLLDVSGISDFSEAELARAKANLLRRGVLDPDGFITDEGILLQSLPVSSIDTAKFLHLAYLLGCPLEAATFVTACSNNVRFFVPGQKGEQAAIAYKRGCLDDLEFYLRLFHVWDAHTRNNRDDAKWVSDSGLNQTSLSKLVEARAKLIQQLSRRFPNQFKVRTLKAENLVLVRAAFLLANPEWTYQRETASTGDCRYAPVLRGQCPLFDVIGIDNNSCCAGVQDLNHFVCAERQKSRKVVMGRHIVRVEDLVNHTDLLHRGAELAIDEILRQVRNLPHLVDNGHIRRDTSAIFSDPFDPQDSQSNRPKKSAGKPDLRKGNLQKA